MKTPFFCFFKLSMSASRRISPWLKISMKKINSKKNTKKKAVRTEKAKPFFTLGNIKPAKARILSVILAIIFLESFILIPRFFQHKVAQAEVLGVSVTPQPKKNANLEKEIDKMVKGYPIEDMVPYIASKDKQVAAFLVAIAKKESAWGKRRPVLNGENCYNYWGFRLKSESMGSGGHTCFDNPKQAVDTVAARIEELVTDYDRDTASKMIVWKCGLSCASHDPDSVKKWISDVDYYYKQVLN